MIRGNRHPIPLVRSAQRAGDKGGVDVAGFCIVHGLAHVLSHDEFVLETVPEAGVLEGLASCYAIGGVDGVGHGKAPELRPQQVTEALQSERTVGSRPEDEMASAEEGDRAGRYEAFGGKCVDVGGVGRCKEVNRGALFDLVGQLAARTEVAYDSDSALSLEKGRDFLKCHGEARRCGDGQSGDWSRMVA